MCENYNPIRGRMGEVVEMRGAEGVTATALGSILDLLSDLPVEAQMFRLAPPQ